MKLSQTNWHTVDPERSPALIGTHHLSPTQEVFEAGLTKADRNILDNIDKKRSRQQSDEQGQKSIWMFPSNKTALYDKENPVALLPVRVAYKLRNGFCWAGYILSDHQTDPVWLVGVGVKLVFSFNKVSWLAVVLIKIKAAQRSSLSKSAESEREQLVSTVHFCLWCPPDDRLGACRLRRHRLCSPPNDSGYYRALFAKPSAAAAAVPHQLLI